MNEYEIKWLFFLEINAFFLETNVHNRHNLIHKFE